MATFVLGIIPVWVLFAMNHADLAHASSRAAFSRLPDQTELGTGLRRVLAVRRSKRARSIRLTSFLEGSS